MSMSYKGQNEDFGHPEPEPLLTRDEFIVMTGLTIITLGIVFVLAESKVIDYGSPWWTLFIGIPGLVFLGASAITTRHQGRITPMAITQFVIGLVGAVLAISFIIDPTWSFTRDWTLFQGETWNTIWRWAIVVLGVAIVLFGNARHSVATIIFGGLLALVGLVFVLNISWNVVWPLAIVAVGLGVLLQWYLQRRQE